jgi:hypothetical protein
VALSSTNRRAGDAAARQDVEGKPATNSRSVARSQWCSVYAGQTCIGFLIGRGRSGVEAFNADEKSLGIFPNNREAAAAVSEKAGSA